MTSKDGNNKKGMNKLQARRFWGIIYGSAFLIISLVFLLWPSHDAFHAQGPMNTGHEKINCNECHKNSDGTLRQQFQAKIRYMLGLRSSAVFIGHKQVGNESCLECHSRPNEQHPVYRFNEPRFAEVRRELAPQNCVSCHYEHNGKRVTKQDVNFCISCHKETKVKNDPLDTSHATLIAQNQWNTCLGCHDFHGNHERKAPHALKDKIAEETLHQYFNGEIESPYSKTKIYPAKTKSVLPEGDKK